MLLSYACDNFISKKSSKDERSNFVENVNINILNKNDFLEVH